MPEVKLQNRILHKVEIIESERGWGQSVEDVKYFDTLTEALEFIDDYNGDMPTDHVPDWYMIARYVGIHNV